jgi:transcriptional regulator with XRE-family HTH domain
MQQIGQNLRQVRETKQLLIREAAAQLDIDPAILSKIERNERRATKDQILRMAQLYQLDAEVLLVDWLSDKVVQDLAGEKLAKKVLKKAVSKIGGS